MSKRKRNTNQDTLPAVPKEKVTTLEDKSKMATLNPDPSSIALQSKQDLPTGPPKRKRTTSNEDKQVSLSSKKSHNVTVPSSIAVNPGSDDRHVDEMSVLGEADETEPPTSLSITKSPSETAKCGVTEINLSMLGCGERTELSSSSPGKSPDDKGSTIDGSGLNVDVPVVTNKNAEFDVNVDTLLTDGDNSCGGEDKVLGSAAIEKDTADDGKGLKKVNM